MQIGTYRTHEKPLVHIQRTAMQMPTGVKTVCQVFDFPNGDHVFFFEVAVWTGKPENCLFAAAETIGHLVVRRQWDESGPFCQPPEKAYADQRSKL